MTRPAKIRLPQTRGHKGCYPVLLILMCLLATTVASAQNGNFPDAWLEALRADARQRGISDDILDAALRDVKPIPRVIELDRRQPEGRMTFAAYVKRVAPPSRVQRGRRLLAQHQTLLRQVSAKYGVPASVIVALWGVESDYGRHTGGFPVIGALATLAHDGRRGTYFRGELLNALQILHEGHIAPTLMTGSWAGAMGQSQFMPSSFLSRAVDYDGDGRRDIWTTHGDIFASAANYLKQAGWRKGERWGRRVKLPPGFNAELIDLKVVKPLADWQALGVRNAWGRALPKAAFDASIIAPDGPQGPAFVVYHNFRVLLKWNRSTYFGAAVGLLANQIAASGQR